MPHRRRVKKGSFGSPLDELVKVFPNEQPGDPTGDGNKPRDEGQGHINDRLFESSWRGARQSRRHETDAGKPT